jgi:hypothetical protein
VVKREITAVFTEVISLLVDLKGIEPSNLTDANRALSQLSYRPNSIFPDNRYYYSMLHGKIQEEFEINLQNREYF